MKKLLISALISGTLLLIMFWYIPVERFSDIPRQIAVFGSILGAALYLFTYVVLAFRWRVIFDEIAARDFPPSLISLFALAAAHNLYSNVLPARTGDMSIVYLSKKYLDIDASKGMASLILARAFDFIVLGLLSMAFLTWQADFVQPTGRAVFPWAVVFVAFPVLGLLMIIVCGQIIATWLEERVTSSAFLQDKIICRKVGLLFVRSMRQLSKPKSGSFYAKCFGLSLILMLARVLMLSVFLVYAVHPVSLGGALLVGCCTLLFLSLPIQSFFGLGAFEGGWVIGCVMTGLSMEDGLVIALNAHLLLLLYLGLLGAVGNTILICRKSDNPNNNQNEREESGYD